MNRLSVKLPCVVGASLFVFATQPAFADAPAWMHAAANATLPAHDEKTDAVLLYSEDITVVLVDGKTKGIERRAYKILRPDGRRYGTVHAYASSASKIGAMRGWCIPAQGKDYEVKDKDAVEIGGLSVENGFLATDFRQKTIRIPASEPGNVVGYEIEYQERPYILQDHWLFQWRYPTLEARYSLQLPPGWEYKAVWINHSEVAPWPVGNNQWQWIVKDVPEVRWEEDMPPLQGLVGQMVVAFLPPSRAPNAGFINWDDMSKWENGLVAGRKDASPEIKQKVAELTTNMASPLSKMQKLAQYLQTDIRYVAIELGIGGWQPHAAPEVFSQRYGDCKDKATLLSAMLKEIGVDSYLVLVNTERGAVTPAMPPMMFWFDHAILAVRLPENLNDSSLQSVVVDPKLGRLLIFDPTDEYTPFGHIRGELQGNYGLLVTADGGNLVRLPQLPTPTSGIIRNGKMSLDARGNLKGDLQEVRLGDAAMYQRHELRSATKDSDKIKPIETLLAHSLADFHITKATVTNLQENALPFQYNYSIVSLEYAKNAGNLMLVRPRIIGNKSTSFLETKEPRKYPVEFKGPMRDSDTFEIALPAGYEVDDLPPPVDVDYSFASYHSKTEASGNTLKYTRTFELKELSVPVSKVDDLKKLYRIIAGDERNTAVLKPAGH